MLEFGICILYIVIHILCNFYAENEAWGPHFHGVPKILWRWLLRSFVHDVQFMVCQTYAECTFCFSCVSDDPSLAFRQVNHVSGSTVPGVLLSLRESCGANITTNGGLFWLIQTLCIYTIHIILLCKYYYHCVHWNTYLLYLFFVFKYRLKLAKVTVAQLISSGLPLLQMAVTLWFFEEECSLVRKDTKCQPVCQPVC